MVVCVIALVVFGFLGIFSATHRQLAKEAFDCVFRKMTFRPCNTGLDKRLRVLTSVKIMKFNKPLGSFVNKHFESLSFLFTLIFVLSFVYAALGLYNFFVYGNCNGQDSVEACLLKPETYNGGFFSFLFKKSPESLKPVAFGSEPWLGNENALVKVVEVGCFSCPFTKATEPIVSEILEKYGDRIQFYFKSLPLPSHSYSFEASLAAECANEQNSFWKYKDALFANQEVCGQTQDISDLRKHYFSYAESIGLDLNAFVSCFDSKKYASVVEKNKREAIEAGVYATPTFFVNGKPVVAPKSFDDIAVLIEEELAKQNS
ncbi:MAG: thioredoxin domain-containing protein [Candidatus Diapherotrites archaeon]